MMSAACANEMPKTHLITSIIDIHASRDSTMVL